MFLVRFDNVRCVPDIRLNALLLFLNRRQHQARDMKRKTYLMGEATLLVLTRPPRDFLIFARRLDLEILLRTSSRKFEAGRGH